jgi:hypothetical protein
MFLKKELLQNYNKEAKVLKKQLVLLGIVAILVTVGLSGCTKQTEEEKVTVKASLNILGLSLEDLDGDFEIVNTNYIEEPFLIESGLLKDSRVLEKYNVTFLDSNAYRIDELITRYESEEKCKSALDKIKTEISKKIPILYTNIIGDDSYFGKTTTTVNENEVSMYFIGFRIADVLVILLGTAPSDETFRGYVVTIENNINEHLE